MNTPMIDAYCHVGLPRFGTAEDALHILAQSQVRRAVFVLGPAVPDYAVLFAALHDYPQRVRGVGIPFGVTLDQNMESVDFQIAGGVLGLRIQEPELLTHAPLLDRLGQAGRWIYAIDIAAQAPALRALLAWLDRYPDARLAAPHFLSTRPLFPGGAVDEALRPLLAHPHFYPIFSRQGGLDSTQPYPHADLRPWVEQVIEQVGWDRILWGSEYPVLFWRDETPNGCRDWLAALLPDMRDEQRAAYLGGNAARAIFDAPPPLRTHVTVPEWVEAQFNRTRPVPLFPHGLQLPMTVYGRVHRRFAQALRADPALTFSRFVAIALDQATPDMTEPHAH
jgi:predicted TIM-barrel fold metal-dependent hydrolase